jgi:transposase-like protein
MTNRHVKIEPSDIKAVLSEDGDFLRNAVKAALQATLEAEMTEALAAERSERSDGRLGYTAAATSPAR